jgi:hypothetical protein
MLRLIANDIELDFDGKISLELKNPLTNDNISRSFPAVLPPTNRNLRACNVSTEAGSSLDKNIALKILIDLELFQLKHDLKIKSVDRKKGIDFNTVQNGFYEWAKSTKITDLDYDDITVSLSQIADYYDNGFSFPKFKNSKHTENWPFTVTERYINDDEHLSDAIVVPCFRLYYILEKIFKTYNIIYNIDDFITTVPRSTSIAIFNAMAINKFKVVSNPKAIKINRIFTFNNTTYVETWGPHNQLTNDLITIRKGLKAYDDDEDLEGNDGETYTITVVDAKTFTLQDGGSLPDYTRRRYSIAQFIKSRNVYADIRWTNAGGAPSFPIIPDSGQEESEYCQVQLNGTPYSAINGKKLTPYKRQSDKGFDNDLFSMICCHVSFLTAKNFSGGYFDFYNSTCKKKFTNDNIGFWNNHITIAGHSFGPSNTNIDLKFNLLRGEGPDQFTNGKTYEFLIMDENTLRYTGELIEYNGDGLFQLMDETKEFKAYDQSAYFTSSRVVDDLDKVNAKNHIPEITCYDFIEALKNKFGFELFFDQYNSKVNLRMYKNLIKKKATKDLTQYAGPIRNIQKNTNTTFRLSEASASSDAYYSACLNDWPDNYNLLSPVGNVSDLPVDSENNDVRYVNNKKLYYIFSGKYYNIETGSWSILKSNDSNHFGSDNADIEIESAAVNMINGTIAYPSELYYIDSLTCEINGSALSLKSIVEYTNDQLLIFDTYPFEGFARKYYYADYSDNYIYNLFWEHYIKFKLNSEPC